MFLIKKIEHITIKECIGKNNLSELHENDILSAFKPIVDNADKENQSEDINEQTMRETAYHEKRQDIGIIKNENENRCFLFLGLDGNFQKHKNLLIRILLWQYEKNRFNHWSCRIHRSLISKEINIKWR